MKSDIPALFGWLVYGAAVAVLFVAIYRHAAESDRAHRELERRRNGW